MRPATGYTGVVPRSSLVSACLASPFFLLLAVLHAPSLAQTYRGGVDLVVVQATVKDADGRLATGLTTDDFQLFEDGLEQRIVQFSGARVPVSLGIAVDISDSMFGERMADARRAIDRFVLSLLQNDDEAFLLVFNHWPFVKVPWTMPPRGLAGRLEGVKPFGGTAIYDALVKAAPMFGKRRNQRCGLVVVSDGNDTASDAKLQDAIRKLNDTDAFVYAIALDAPSGAAINRTFSPGALNEITGQTGGYTEIIHDSAALGGATERIANELNHQYTLGYVPSRQADGQYHTIRVRSRDPKYTVRARRGYVHQRIAVPGQTR
jgi:Ca-activated chloride channel homolog